MDVPGVNFHKASFSSTGGCVEVGFHINSIDGPTWAYVRNSRDHSLAHLVPIARWRELVAGQKPGVHLDLAIWFPSDRYGNFAAAFTEAERYAFEQGINAREQTLVGPEAEAA